MFKLFAIGHILHITNGNGISRKEIDRLDRKREDETNAWKRTSACLNQEVALAEETVASRLSLGPVSETPDIIYAERLKRDQKHYDLWAVSGESGESSRRLEEARKYLKQLEGSGVAPTVVDIKFDADFEYCGGVVMIMDGENLGGACEGTENVFELAVRALNILKVLRRKGIVHGYITCETLVRWKQNGDTPADIRLLPMRNYAPRDERQEQRSHWRLEGATKSSFRDDVMNLAELLLRKSGHEERYKRALAKLGTRNHSAGLIALKKDRPLDFSTPWILREFYKYCVSLGEDDAIDYDKFIKKFQSKIKKPKGSASGNNLKG